MFCDALEKMSPVPVYYCVVTPNIKDMDSYGERVVKYYELEFVDSGTGHVLADGKKVPATDHTLLFRRPGMIVEGIGVYSGHFVGFHFNAEEEIIDALNVMPLSYKMNEWPQIKEIFTEIFADYFSENPMRLLLYKIHIMHLFELMMREWYYHTTASHLNNELQENLNRVVAYIHKHYHSHMTIEMLADRAGYSTFHFSRTFRQFIGETPIQYLNRIRINKVKQLLVETTHSSEEIMAQCGFFNYSYYLRTFRKQCGVTPRQFKLKHQCIR